MKILVCTDGSEHSKKTYEKAALIADGCNVEEVAVIHVYDEKLDLSVAPRRAGASVSEKEVEVFHKLQEDHKNQKKMILQEALDFFQSKDIHARSIFKEGHPSSNIVKVGCDGGFDIIVIGSRGKGGLKKTFLGSVSNAVIQEAKDCSVLTVK